VPFGNQEENKMGSRVEGKGGRACHKPHHEIPEHGAVQSFTTSISPAPIFPTFGADAGVPITIDVHPSAP
jgi:hypothetical protein